ncbi:sugar ABC transporter substrate-binding protein [Frankia nepalensis]|nr:substrate-binding domain-containing protein [Frankia nepalensis]
MAALLAAAGCSTDSDDESEGGAASAPPAASPSGDPLAATVEKLLEPASSLPVPTEKLDGVAALKGKTVYYVPITQQSSQFKIIGSALTEALNSVGVSVQVCNGGANPTTISACVNQAIGANAGAVVTDAIPYGMAANALDTAQAKNIPVLITNQIIDPAHPASKTLGYVEGGGTAQLTAVADWIIVDSGGEANIVINGSTDSPSSRAYVESFQEEISTHCEDCKVTVNEISSANFPLISPSTSSAILRTPGVNYVISEFDQYLQPTLAGVQQSGKITSVKGGSGSAQLAGLQMLAAKNFLYVDAGQASTFQGWVDADAVLRLMLGTPLPEYEPVVRLFTRENVTGLNLTPEGEATGEWYGPTTFPAQFKALWGLS